MSSRVPQSSELGDLSHPSPQTWGTGCSTSAQYFQWLFLEDWRLPIPRFNYRFNIISKANDYLEAAWEAASLTSERSVQVDDFIASHVCDVHVKGSHGSTALSGAAVCVLLGIVNLLTKTVEHLVQEILRMMIRSRPHGFLTARKPPFSWKTTFSYRFQMILIFGRGLPELMIFIPHLLYPKILTLGLKCIS